MLDLETEQPISFREAGELVPGGVHRATVSRWASMGVGPKKVMLESDRIAGRVVTTKEALVRFLQRCRQGRWQGIAGGTGYALEQAMQAGWLNELTGNENASRDDRDQLTANNPAPSQAGRSKRSNDKVSIRDKLTPRQTKTPKRKS